MSHIKVWVWAALLGTAAFLTGCSASTLVSDLNLVVDAGTVALTALSGTVVPAPVATAALNYLDQVATVSSQAATELASTDSAAQKASVIIADFSTVVISSPISSDPKVSAIIRAVDAAIQIFLSHLKTAAAVTTQNVAMAQSFTDAKKTSAKLSAGDKKKLGKIKKKADDLKSKVHAKK